MEYREYKSLTWLEILERIEIPKDKYDYVTALRGCDIDNYCLKSLFTCFLRGKSVTPYANIDRFESYIISKDAEIRATELEEIVKDGRKDPKLSNAYLHCLRHIYASLYVIETHLNVTVARLLKEIATELILSIDEIKPFDKSKIIKLLRKIKEIILKGD